MRLMARRKHASESGAAVRVGDRVRFRVGALDVLAEVVDDHGAIGVGGRRLLSVAVTSADGEVDRFDVPADDVTVVPRDRATS